MNIRKVVGLVAVAVAVIATFVAFPYATLVLALLGIPIGLAAPGDAHVRVLVSALVLNVLGHAFDTIPAIGPYVGAIIANIGIVLAGAALAIVFKNIYARLTE
jgi:hypothetical protein